MKEFQVNWSTHALALFTDVTNSKDLLNAMQAGKLEPEVVLLNASLIPDVFPVLAAAHKVLLAKLRESLPTRTLHAELVYNNSGSKHISESLKRRGISDSTTYILAACFGASPNEMEAIVKLILGKEINLAELRTRANEAQILRERTFSLSRGEGKRYRNLFRQGLTKMETFRRFGNRMGRRSHHRLHQHLFWFLYIAYIWQAAMLPASKSWLGPSMKELLGAVLLLDVFH